MQQGIRSTEAFLRYYVVKHEPPLKGSVTTKNGKLDQAQSDSHVESPTDVTSQNDITSQDQNGGNTDGAVSNGNNVISDDDVTQSKDLDVSTQPLLDESET